MSAEDDPLEKRVMATTSKSQFNTKAEYKVELDALFACSKINKELFVSCLGWFEDDKDVHIFMEYLPLGDLEAKIPEGIINESEIRDIASQILEALKIMHGIGYSHRNLKLKHILVRQNLPRKIQLSGYKVTKLRTNTTTYEPYVAPEMQVYPGRFSYDSAVDLWSLGCILYRLASGVVPFPTRRSLTDYCEAYGENKAKFPYPLAMSSTGAKFIQNLFVPNPENRLTAATAQDNLWIKNL